MINSLKRYLSKRLKQQLPGKTAHIELAPYRNVEFSKTIITNAKKSGVLILFYLKDNEIYTILMQRNIYNGQHSGQISLPGGKREKIDKNISQTALREANEEIGVKIEAIEVIGQLSNVYIPVSNFHITPVVGITNDMPKFILDKREVQELIELKIDTLIKENPQKTNIKLHNNTIINIPAFIIKDKVIWGATAIILNELRHILQGWNNS